MFIIYFVLFIIFEIEVNIDVVRDFFVFLLLERWENKVWLFLLCLFYINVNYVNIYINGNEFLEENKIFIILYIINFKYM